MAFIDELDVEIKAGDGGNGVVRWLHVRGNAKGGPSGGDGGKGGHVYIRGVRDIGRLAQYRHTPEFEAERGEDGKNNTMKGKNGESLFIELPIGSVLTNKENGEVFEILKDGEEILVLKGGNGGYGNDHFKGPENQNPVESTKGKKGDMGTFHIELKLIADAGLIGLPSAGKSTLLNTLTNSNVKVGSYDFTTLEPNLGVFFGYVLADIPGLIEGASEGKGLGHKFLRHIVRTKILIHCISLTNIDIADAYNTIRNELVSHSPDLIDKKEIIVLTKKDEVTDEQIKETKATIQKIAPEKDIIAISILDEESISNLGSLISKTLSL